MSAVIGAFFTLSVQAALAFQRYRFDRGVMVGTTLAAVNWCEEVARRKDVPPSRLPLIVSIAAALLALQQAARALAAGLPQALTHS